MWRIRNIDKELYEKILEVEGDVILSKTILIDARDENRAKQRFYQAFPQYKKSNISIISAISEINHDLADVKMIVLNNNPKEARRVFNSLFPDRKIKKS